jgi:hypothetical protein
MKARAVWPAVVVIAGAVLIGGVIWWRSPRPQVPPVPPDVKAREATSAPPVPSPSRPAPEPEPPPADSLLRRWQGSVRRRDEKGVISAQQEFLSKEGEYREPLATMAKTDAEPRVRAFSIAVLGRMKAPPPEEFFVERLGDAHEYPRTSALQALEKSGTARCLAELDRLASADPAEAVRRAAAQAAKVVRSR